MVEDEDLALVQNSVMKLAYEVGIGTEIAVEVGAEIGVGIQFGTGTGTGTGTEIGTGAGKEFGMMLEGPYSEQVH